MDEKNENIGKILYEEMGTTSFVFYGITVSFLSCVFFGFLITSTFVSVAYIFPNAIITQCQNTIQAHQTCTIELIDGVRHSTCNTTF